MPIPIRCILVDDEPDSLEVMRLELAEHCPTVEVVGAFNDPKQAIAALPQLRPDLTFLDIEMPGMNGFAFIDAANGLQGQVIFVTAYDSFAIQAFKAKALDYLLKPILSEDLTAAVARANDRIRNDGLREEVAELVEQIRQQGAGAGRVMLPTADGFEFVDSHEIRLCQGDNNYTHVYLTNGKKMLLSRTLKTMEEVLEKHGFVRVHNSWLVNPAHIRKFVRNEGGYLVMDDGTHVPIARSRKGDFLNQL